MGLSLKNKNKNDATNFKEVLQGLNTGYQTTQTSSQ